MKKIHLIGNAHLDPVWLWRRQEGYSEVLATFKSALDRIEEFDDFIFTSAAQIYYEWVEETDPEMFAEIKKRVAEGKWVIVGGWLVQPDCNAPCGESFARHSLYGQSYFKEKFGKTATVGYNVDSFGHSAMLPQILKKSGMDSYVYMRPAANEHSYAFEKNTFLWISPDGSRVKTFRIQDFYNSLGFEEAAKQSKDIKELSDKQNEPLMSFYGVGNHGGGPTIKNILSLKGLMKSEEGVYEFSSPERFFEEISEESLPVYTGDLHHHSSGCYSTIMNLKALNRKAEAALTDAEKAEIMAVLTGVKREAENLKELWKPTLFNQFHDILCGCCIKEGIKDAIYDYGASISGASNRMNKALQAIAWNIDTSKKQPVILNKTDFRLWENENVGTPFIVFNPNSFPVKTPLSLGTLVKSVEDCHGNPIPTQKIRASRTAVLRTSDNWDTEIIADVPAMGWKLYYIYANKEAEEAFEELPFKNNTLENDGLSVHISDEGYIDGIFDKELQTEYLSAPILPLIIDETDCDTWAHGVFSFNNVVGKFSNPEIVFENSGAIRRDIRIKYTYNRSSLITDIAIYRGLNRVYLNFKVNWQEKHKMLKIAIPTVFKNAKDTASVPYGFIERGADGLEEPMQKWLFTGEGENGVGIATDTRTAYDFKDGTLRITALRSPIYADHYGVRDEYCEYTEQGEQSFKIAIEPVKRGYFHKIYRLGEILLSPLPTILGTYRKGALAGEGSLVNLDADNVVITAFKPAEDGNGFILHCSETDGKSARVKISIPLLDAVITTDIAPQEIKVFRIAGGKFYETDFIER